MEYSKRRMMLNQRINNKRVIVLYRCWSNKWPTSRALRKRPVNNTWKSVDRSMTLYKTLSKKTKMQWTKNWEKKVCVKMPWSNLNWKKKKKYSKSISFKKKSQRTWREWTLLGFQQGEGSIGQSDQGKKRGRKCPKRRHLQIIVWRRPAPPQRRGRTHSVASRALPSTIWITRASEANSRGRKKIK